MDQLREYDDDYLRCRDYHTNVPGDDGFHRFEKEGQFYFAFLDLGIVVLRSEGYATEKSRDNGIESVKKNMDDEDNYAVIELPGGQFALSLKAQNAKEIARTCAEDTEDGAKSYLPSARKEFGTEFLRLASVEAGTVGQEDVAFEGNPHAAASAVASAGSTSVAASSSSAASSEDDDYMICREYQEKADAIDADDNGIVKFQHENTGKYYFAWVGEDRKVILRSEGYPTTAARDNGAESVIKNREIRDRFKIVESHGAYFLILKAGNHQEIGRSCPAESEAALWGMLDSGDNNAVELAAASVASVAAVVEEPIVEIVTPEPVVEVKAAEPVVELIAEAPAVEEKVEEAAPVIEVAAVAAAAVAATTSTSTPPAEKAKTEYKEKDKDDDYLHCDEYKGYTIADKANNIAFFKHKNGQFYFAVYNKNGSVKLRSEGFRTAAERDQELKGVIKHLNDNKMYTNIERGGYVIRVLKDKSGREVGRSCPEKVGAAAPVVEVAKPVAAATAAAATVAAATSYTETPTPRPIAPPPPVPEVVTGSGFNWMWLLPLLLIPLFFWWKSCNKVDDAALTATSVTDTTVTAVSAPVDTAKALVAEAPEPAPAAAPSCDLNWIFFDFDRYNIRSEANDELQLMAKILKENPTYVGLLNAHTDARGDDAYNQRLSQNRANAAKDVLVGLGIDAGRVTTTANSEGAPLAENTDDDSGRKFNRRVELFVKDASGKDICKSIPPTVPSNLKK